MGRPLPEDLNDDRLGGADSHQDERQGVMSGDLPTILIVAVNPLSATANNGKTIASMFRGYPQEALAQLYFHREVPTSEVCSNYFRIADDDIARAIRTLSPISGARVVAPSAEERAVPRGVADFLKKSQAVRLLRSLIWGVVNLDRGAAREWLDEVRPDLIFFCGGDSNHLYRKVHRLAERYNAPIVYYITDDYVLPVRTLNVFAAINRAWTRRAFKSMCRASALVLTIGDEMARVYEQKFGVRSVTAMNMVDVPDVASTSTAPTRDALVLSYLGGLHSNRWRVLHELGASLERLAPHGLIGELRVYSGEPVDPAVEAALTRHPYSSFCGRLDAEGVKAVMLESDVLVHVESDDPKSKAVTRLSVSTKIPEYMASGKPLLALGPSDIGSIRYLVETESAFVAASLEPDDIDATLSAVLIDDIRRHAYAQNAWRVARARHHAATVRPQLQSQFVAIARQHQSSATPADT